MAVLEIRGPGPHEGAEGGLRRAVDTEGGRTFHARDRAVENNRATILQQRQGFLHSEQGSLDVDVEELVEMLLRDLFQGGKFSDAGVGEDDVKLPFCFDCLIKAVEVCQFGNVSLNASDVSADRLHGRVELFLTAARDEDEGTLSYEELCRRKPHPGCATGNDCYLSLQLLGFGHGM